MFSYPQEDLARLGVMNPYFAEYDQQQQQPSAFTNKCLAGQSQRTVSQFVPTSSHPEAVLINSDALRQLQQKVSLPDKTAAASYDLPKSTLHVGADKPMAREERVARYGQLSRLCPLHTICCTCC